jgi:hypothetical protein
MNRRFLAVSLFLAATAYGQPVPVDVEAGFRFLDLRGSSDMYRTQINERSGFLIRALTVAGAETKYADYFRIDANDLGVGPAGALRIDFGRSSLYRFTLAYRQSNAFTALPNFANGQHTHDRDRRMIDADLELRKWNAITPFFGLSWNRYSGPGTTTYHIGEDEFALRSHLSNRDEEIRAGFGFSYKNFTGQLTQGWRSFRDHETLTLAPGANAGNNSDPILGRQLSAGAITRDDNSSGHTPFTNIYAIGQFTGRVRVIGNYVRFAADSHGNGSEDATGTLAAFTISRFFSGFSDQASGRAKNTTWRGGARAEITLTDKLDGFAGFQHEHRALEGSALITDLFLQTVNFGGLDPRDVQVILNAHNSLDRDEDVFSAAVSARSLGPFSFRAGVSESKQDVSVTPDLSEIVVPGASQGGRLHRRVTTSDLSGSYGNHGFMLGAAWRHDTANDPIMRTDFLQRDRFRLRAGWVAPEDRIRASLTAEESNPKNDRSQFAYDAKIRQITADAEVAATDKSRVHASASRFKTNSSILYRRPETFAIDTSRHEENGKSVEGGVLVAWTSVSADAALARFTNRGTYPFDIDRFRTRAMFPLRGKAGLTAEWDHDRYSDVSAPFADFTADRYGIYVRWTR